MDGFLSWVPRDVRVWEGRFSDSEIQDSTGGVLSADPPQVVGRTDDLFDVSIAETAPTVRW